MTAQEAYEKYNINVGLQMHMLRVAAVASIICDSLLEPIEKEDILSACLLHDMGNIIKANLDLFPELLEPQGVGYWQKIKEEYIKKYGPDEKKANRKIVEELGVSSRVISLISQFGFPLACKHRDSDDYVTKIISYSDWRVDPHGVKSYEDRMNEAKKRYKRNTQAEEDEREKLIKCGKDIEKQIFSKCKIQPEDITDESVAPIIEELKNFVIKL